METENNKTLTPERSLEIISNAIEQNRKSMEKNAGNSMIAWGVLVVNTAVIVMASWRMTGSAACNWLWFVMAIIGFAYEHVQKKRREPTPVNVVGKTIGDVWLSFAIFTLALPIILVLLSLAMKSCPPAGETSHLYLPITGFIAMMMGLCAAITGFVLKNKWIVAGAVVSGLLGFAASFVLNGPHEMLIIAFVAVVGLIVPGLIINLKSKQDNV